MKRSTLSVVLMFVALMAGSRMAIAADASFGVDFMSAYVWRGITFNDGWVAQPYIDVAAENGFGVNVWGNIDMEEDYSPDGLENGEFSEVDWTLSYGRTIGMVDVSAGYIEYLFPAGGEGTREVYAGLGIEPVAGLSVGVTAYYDFDEVEDLYAVASVAYSVDVADGLGVECGVSAGYAGQDASSGGDGGLHDYMLSLSASYAITEAFGIGAKLAYVNTLDEDVLSEQDVDFFGGVSLSYLL